MAHKRRKLSKLIFPDLTTWTDDWLTNSILATPKWQINAVLGSYSYNQWITYLAGKLDGYKLPERVNPETNWQRSMAVGIGVAIASQEYENTKIKEPASVENKFLKDILERPMIQVALGQTTLSAPVKNKAEIGKIAEAVPVEQTVYAKSG